jgi:hypothetical protein
MQFADIYSMVAVKQESIVNEMDSEVWKEHQMK